MTTLGAITTINETLPVLKSDSDLARALNVALSALRERHRAELAGQWKDMTPEEPSGYPMTIVKDRFGGTYSGGAYTAWNLEPWEIPGDLLAGDTSCCEFLLHSRLIYGKGNTPDEAERDLMDKISG